MKLSVRKKFGFVHCRGGRILRVAHPHQVPVDTYNNAHDEQILADKSFRDAKDGFGNMPFKPRSFDGKWVTAELGDIAIEIVARKTSKVLGHGYLSGPALNLIRYTRDTPVFEHWFAAGKGLLLEGFDPAVKNTAEYSLERFVSSMMEVKYGGADVAAMLVDVPDVQQLEACAHACAQSYGYSPMDGDEPIKATTPLLGAIHCKKEKRHCLLHLQPPSQKSDFAAQPFFFELVYSSPELVVHPFWIDGTGDEIPNLPCAEGSLPKFHVLVQWPDPTIESWLVLIEGKDADDARRAVETDPKVVEAGGKVVEVTPA